MYACMYTGAYTKTVLQRKARVAASQQARRFSLSFPTPTPMCREVDRGRRLSGRSLIFCPFSLPQAFFYFACSCLCVRVWPCSAGTIAVLSFALRLYNEAVSGD